MSMRARKDQGSRVGDDSGEATIEFIVLAIAIIIPVIYLVVTAANVHAAAYATEAAARETARILAHHPGDEAYAQKQWRQIFSDYHIDAGATVVTRCEPMPCTVESTITVDVTSHVALPLIPLTVLGTPMPAITVESHKTMPVEGVRIVDE